MYEWERVKNFVRCSDFGGEEYNKEPNEIEMLQRHQLRCLWTAYCILGDLEPDTAGYDNRIMELWETVIENRKVIGSNDEFDDFTCFDLWMGELLC